MSSIYLVVCHNKVCDWLSLMSIRLNANKGQRVKNHVGPFVLEPEAESLYICTMKRSIFVHQNTYLCHNPWIVLISCGLSRQSLWLVELDVITSKCQKGTKSQKPICIGTWGWEFIYILSEKIHIHPSKHLFMS